MYNILYINNTILMVKTNVPFFACGYTPTKSISWMILGYLFNMYTAKMPH